MFYEIGNLERYEKSVQMILISLESLKFDFVSLISI